MNLRDVLKQTHNYYGRLRKATVTIEPVHNSLTCFGRLAAKGEWPPDPKKDPMIALLVCSTEPQSELSIVEDDKPGRWPAQISLLQLSELAYCAMAKGRCGILWLNGGLIHIIDREKIMSKARQIDSIEKSIELGGPDRPRMRKFLWSETYEVPLIKTESGDVLLDWAKWCISDPASSE